MLARDITKTPDRNDFKVGTVVVLDTMSKTVDFGFKRSRGRVIGVRESAPSYASPESAHFLCFRLLPDFVAGLAWRRGTMAVDDVTWSRG